MPTLIAEASFISQTILGTVVTLSTIGGGGAPLRTESPGFAIPALSRIQRHGYGGASGTVPTRTTGNKSNTVTNIQ